MKKIILIVACLVSFYGISQNLRRIQVQGKVIVESADISGITVFNSTSNKGTITDSRGNFVLEVALNDLINVSALQFTNVSFKVNESIINSKTIKVFLIEEIHELDEIVIFEKGLSGNLNADIKTVETFEPKLHTFYFERNIDDDFKGEVKPKLENVATDSEGQFMKHGLNLVNVVDQLLLPIFRREVKDKKLKGIPDIPVESVKYYFGADFLVDNFNIPQHRVDEFIRFVETEDFNYTLLNYGNEMEFLELLTKKSKEFLGVNEFN
jgi:hypothetical protein